MTNAFIRMLLNDDKNAVMRVLLLPHQRALLRGAQFGAEELKFANRLLWGNLVLFLVFAGSYIAALVLDGVHEIGSALMAVFFLYLVSMVFMVRLGHRNKDIVPNRNLPFDLAAASAGGAWAVIGIGLYAVLSYFFGS